MKAHVSRMFGRSRCAGRDGVVTRNVPHSGTYESAGKITGKPCHPWLVLAMVALATLAGCKKEPVPKAASATNPGPEVTKIRVGYIGISCEAPIFTAVEKGFFKEEGLEVEMVRCQWAQYKDVLALGGYDITHHLVMYFLKPIEQGMDVKFTGGIHRGCLRVQAPVNSPIKTVKDLRGKRIGVPGMGTPPFIFANRVLGANGIDPGKDIQWRVFPAGDLGLAMEKGLVDAVADSEPIGTLLEAEGKVKNIADQAVDAPYNQEYCCAVLLNGEFLRKYPKASAAGTRAMLKGAKWVQANPLAAARLSVEKKYILSSPELNAIALAKLDYVPSVSGADHAVKAASAEMRTAGMLLKGTDVEALAKHAFVQLDGVSDEWIKNLQVEKVAGGQVPAHWDIRQFAQEIYANKQKSCCVGKLLEPPAGTERAFTAAADGKAR
jgi:NitT/TauT family transport system substrate-binding protein